MKQNVERWPAVMLSLLIACSSPSQQAVDAAPDAALAHTPLPQVTTAGGPVLAHVQLVTITFSGYTFADTVEAFGDWIVGSSWLQTVGADYGVGTGTHVAKVRLSQTAPTVLTRSDMEQLIASAITGGTVPAPTTDTLYALYLPPTTTFTDGGSQTSCVDFSGYHTEGTAGAMRFAFAAIGACDGYVAGLSLAENVERTASHEMIEGATDPYTQSARAYVLLDTTNPWAYPDAEVADICRVGWIVREAGFVAQRSWSNVAAAADRAPCIPADERAPYENVSIDPATVPSVAPGQSITFAVRGWSTPPDASWSIHVPATTVGAVHASAQLDTAAMSDGGTATLTLSVPADAPHGSYGYLRIASAATSAELPLGNYWPVVVRVP